MPPDTQPWLNSGGKPNMPFDMVTGPRGGAGGKTSTVASGGVSVSNAGGVSGMLSTNVGFGGTPSMQGGTTAMNLSHGGSGAAGQGVGGAHLSSGGAPATAPGQGGAPAQPSENASCPSPTRARLANGSCVERITEFSVASSPTSIVVGSDRMIWFHDAKGNQVAKIDTDGQPQGSIQVGDPNAQRELVSGIGDELIWFTDAEHGRLVKVTSAEIPLFDLGFAPTSITRGPGNVDFWITALDGVNRVSAADGHLVLHKSASPRSSIAVGPDNNLWFANAGTLVRMDLDGEVDEFPISSDGNINDLCAGPDGTLWYTDTALHQIGHVDTDGHLIRTFDPGQNTGPLRIVVGPDDALWFTEQSVERIGRITINGDMNHYPIPTSPGGPYGIVAGPDRNVWFTEVFSGKLGRLRLDQ